MHRAKVVAIGVCRRNILLGFLRLNTLIMTTPYAQKTFKVHMGDHSQIWCIIVVLMAYGSSTR